MLNLKLVSKRTVLEAFFEIITTKIKKNLDTEYGLFLLIKKYCQKKPTFLQDLENYALKLYSFKNVDIKENLFKAFLDKNLGFSDVFKLQIYLIAIQQKKINISLIENFEEKAYKIFKQTLSNDSYQNFCNEICKQHVVFFHNYLLKNSDYFFSLNPQTVQRVFYNLVINENIDYTCANILIFFLKHAPKDFASYVISKKILNYLLYIEDYKQALEVLESKAFIKKYEFKLRIFSRICFHYNVEPPLLEEILLKAYFKEKKHYVWNHLLTYELQNSSRYIQAILRQNKNLSHK